MDTSENEQGDGEVDGDICFMLTHEDISSRIILEKNVERNGDKILDLVHDSDAEEEDHGNVSANIELPSNDSSDVAVENENLVPRHEIKYNEELQLVVIDTVVSLHIFPDHMGFTPIQLRPIRVRSVHESRMLTNDTQHPI